MNKTNEPTKLQDSNEYLFITTADRQEMRGLEIMWTLFWWAQRWYNWLAAAECKIFSYYISSEQYNILVKITLWSFAHRKLPKKNTNKSKFESWAFWQINRSELKINYSIIYRRINQESVLQTCIAIFIWISNRVSACFRLNVSFVRFNP